MILVGSILVLVVKTGIILTVLVTCATDVRAGALTAGRRDKEEVGTERSGPANASWEPCPYPPSETIAGIEFDVSTR